MTTQNDKAEAFRDLHVAGRPLVLYNIWSAGSAKAVEHAGAAAIATGSWSAAAAQGYEDGEEMPLDEVLRLARQVVSGTELPVTFDFEGAYAVTPEDVAANTRKLIATGVVGVNFEDQVVGKPGLHAITDQAERIRAIRSAANEADVPFFINARTDLFLKAELGTDHASLIEQAIERETAYREAGADGYFIPGLTQSELIRNICERANLPINVMAGDGFDDIAAFAQLGVARVSFGPYPYISLMATLEERASKALARR